MFGETPIFQSNNLESSNWNNHFSKWPFQVPGRNLATSCILPKSWRWTVRSMIFLKSIGWCEPVNQPDQSSGVCISHFCSSWVFSLVSAAESEDRSWLPENSHLGTAWTRQCVEWKWQPISGWWFQPTHLKICSSKWVHLPQGSGWKLKKYVTPPPRYVRANP